MSESAAGIRPLECTSVARSRHHELGLGSAPLNVAAHGVLNEVGAVLEPAERPLRDETLEWLRSALGSEALDAHLAEGAGLPFGEALATARRLAAGAAPAQPGP